MPHAPLPEAEVDRQWLWFARVALLACPPLMFLFGLVQEFEERILARVLPLLPWMLPYFPALLGPFQLFPASRAAGGRVALSKAPWLFLAQKVGTALGALGQRWREMALLLAMFIGAVGTLVWLFIFYLAQTETHRGFYLELGDPRNILSGLLTISHLLLFVSARKLARKRTWWVGAVRWAAAAVASLALLLTALWMVFFVVLHRPHPGSPETSAVSSVRTINTAQATYASTYPHKGYATTLAALAPPPEGHAPSETAADLIEPLLASGQKSGYRLTLLPGSPDEKGVVAGYRLIARPLQYGKTGFRSFYSDESGMIRATAEDRPPTKDDPPL